MNTINKRNKSVKAHVETHEPEAVSSTSATSVFSEKIIYLIHYLTAYFIQLARNLTLSPHRIITLDIIRTFIFMVGYIKLSPRREVISHEGVRIGLCFRKFHEWYSKHQLSFGNIRFWSDTTHLQNEVYKKECRYFIECNKTGQNKLWLTNTVIFSVFSFFFFLFLWYLRFVCSSAYVKSHDIPFSVQ